MTRARAAPEPGDPGLRRGERLRDRRTDLFCSDWVRDHWGDTLQPALLEHIKLTLIAVAIGFVLAFAAALVAHRYRRLDQPIGLFSGFLYTIPSLALFQLLVPVTGLTVTTVEVALVGYTLLILYRNILEGLRAAPPDVLEAARGMGLTPPRCSARRAAARGAGDHRRPADRDRVDDLDRDGRRVRDPGGARLADLHRAPQDVFKTEIIAAGALAVVLALAADALLVLARARADAVDARAEARMIVADLGGRSPTRSSFIGDNPGLLWRQDRRAPRALGRRARRSRS